MFVESVLSLLFFCLFKIAVHGYIHTHILQCTYMLEGELEVDSSRLYAGVLVLAVGLMDLVTMTDKFSPTAIH